MTRVLVCSEFSQIGSGYSTYTHELLKGLYSKGMEFAELASFCRPDDSRIRNCKWRVYPVMPHPSDKTGNDIYQSHPANAFGKAMFEQVLLDYKPTHVIDVRDVWNFVHEFTSPLRDYYAHLVMPAIDSDPQNKIWLDLYKKADGIVTYCDWANQLLREKYGLTNVFGSATPVPPMEYQPLPDKDKLKQSLGLGDIKVIGTVMRNQPRKLFPKLFKVFARFLQESKRNDVYLYAHTGYPDIWELDELLLEHGVGHKVLFTYVCSKCNWVETSFYKGPFSHCIRCKSPEKSLKLPQTSYPIPQSVLNQIYNIFDLYIQYAALEGYGIPLAEAASAGLPSMCVRYSAMETFINEGNAIPIEVAEYQIEAETGRRFAIPDENDTVEKLKSFFNKSDAERENLGKLNRMLYGTRNFNDSTEVWLNAINKTSPKLQWNGPPKQYKIPKDFPKNLSSTIFARWLILEVLQDVSLLSSYFEARLVRDLDNGFALIGHDNKYYYEAMGIPGQRFQQFGQEIAFTHFMNLLQEKVEWEGRRLGARDTRK